MRRAASDQRDEKSTSLPIRFYLLVSSRYTNGVRSFRGDGGKRTENKNVPIRGISYRRRAKRFRQQFRYFIATGIAKNSCPYLIFSKRNVIKYRQLRDVYCPY